MEAASNALNRLQQRLAGLPEIDGIRLQAELAESYRALGQLALLFSALERGIELGRLRHDNALLRLTALGFAAAGALDRALGIPGLIRDVQKADRLRLTLFERTLYDDRDPAEGYRLLERLDVFRLPGYRLRAALMLFQFATAHELAAKRADYLHVVTRTLGEFRDQPEDYAIAQAVVGRWLLRSGENTLARQAFNEAQMGAMSLAGETGDKTRQVVALQLAKAGLTAEAKTLAGLISAEALRQETTTTIQTLEKIWLTDR
ncbi:hypothetical protein MIT9_P2485 [Methylomarinovum caldicuralii]|uniref:Uncharacterized protein n=1 Tax=Methylomarinovum caldicuralii TaxID=438856 RepID=A0AAU9CE25_9GAMM|nr:hypothetical protein [Methylomarinovum caldicuralii]BCX82894.1 hypothetical protein MIT9_P2485 [Methylomarinovum caldicuralii]